MKKHFVEFWEDITSLDKAKQRAEVIQQKINKYLKEAKSILELGMGIGVVLRNFPEKYCITGLDIEEEYVNYCSKKLPRGSYYHTSMHNFRLQEKFDVIFSVYDSINFLENFDQWVSTFKHTFNHLNEHGLFVFDMYTPKILEEKEILQPVFEEFSYGYTVDVGKIDGNLLEWELLVFEHKKENLYEKHIFNWFERIYSIEQVKKELLTFFEILEEEYFEDDKRIRFTCLKRIIC